jgi:putative Mn2+ efflux pump MntP
MRQILYAIAIALANNVDNIGVMIAYGLRGQKIDLPMKLWITLITFAISTLAASLGVKIAGSLGQAVCSSIAAAILIGFGSWMVAESYLAANRPRAGKPGDVDVGHATLLGVALSINNVAGGVGAGLIALNPFVVGALSALFSFAALGLGNYMAEVLERHRVADRAALLGGLLLIAVGVEQVLQVRT